LNSAVDRLTAVTIADVLDHEDGHDQEGDHRPRQACGPGDAAAGGPTALLDRLEEHRHDGRHDRPGQDASHLGQRSS
jgi:hypothetical protein